VDVSSGVPLFTASRGFALIDQTPAHVHAEVSGEVKAEDSDSMDLGTIVHGCLLTGESNVVLIEAKDWRTAAAREQRDDARAVGLTPLLAHKWSEVQAMVAAARRQLERVELPTPFVGGVAEQSLYFDLDGVQCRATPDWVSDDHAHIDDLKTVGTSAHPAAFGKAAWGNGNCFQNAFYRRAVKTVYGVNAEFRWVALETFPPYSLSVVALDPEATEFADAQVDEALRIWALCLERGEWPGYPTRVSYTEVPAWVKSTWLERSYFDNLPAR
jgi:hypothetical protein